jgi:hypothetical protein
MPNLNYRRFTGSGKGRNGSEVCPQATTDQAVTLGGKPCGLNSATEYRMYDTKHKAQGEQRSRRSGERLDICQKSDVKLWY